MRLRCTEREENQGYTETKKIELSYGVICATLSRLNINLQWADDQYLPVLMTIMGEYTKSIKKPERKKVGASDIGKYIV